MKKWSARGRIVGLVALAIGLSTGSISTAQTDGDERLVTISDTSQIALTAKAKLKSLDRDLVPELDVAGTQLVGDRDLSLRYFARAQAGLPAGSGLSGNGKVQVEFACFTAEGKETLSRQTVKFDKMGNAAVQVLATPSEPCDRVRAVRKFKGGLSVAGGGTLTERFSVTPQQISSLRREETCTPDVDTLCLQNNRFQVDVEWRDDGNRGDSTVMPTTLEQGALFFFDSDNFEMIVRVLDGCSVNNRFWVFAAGLTNVEVTLTVTDTMSGATQIYDNPAGTQFDPLTDFGAFDTCP